MGNAALLTGGNDARAIPIGLKQGKTGARAWQRKECFARGGIPELDGVILGGDDAGAIGADGDAVGGDGYQHFTRSDIPETNRLIVAGGDDAHTIGAKGEQIDAGGVASEG